MTTAIAVGDSITRTGGAIVSDDVEPLSWSQRVAAAAGWHLDTFAQSGAATSTILGLIPDEGDYDIALTCVGTNDVLSPRRWDAGKFRREFTEVLTRLDSIASRTIVLGLVPNVGKLPVPFGYGWGLSKRVVAANKVIAEVSEQMGAVAVFPAPLSRPIDQFGDCVHPTSIGHIRLANEVLARLGLPPVTVTFEPSAHFLSWTKGRLLSDSVKRPIKGLAASLLAAARL